jgi:hypothetical protein
MKLFFALITLCSLLLSTQVYAEESVITTTVGVQALACHYEEDSLNIFESHMYGLPATQEMMQELKDQNKCILLTVPIDASRLDRCLDWLEDCRGFSMEYNGEKYFVTLFPPF